MTTWGRKGEKRILVTQEGLKGKLDPTEKLKRQTTVQKKEGVIALFPQLLDPGKRKEDGI